MNVAIIGAGLMGRWHAKAAKRAGANVVSDSGDVDVVHVCTPLAAHAELAERAIEAGRHVLVEKPLAPTAVETERLLKMAGERGVLLCPVHQFLFQDGVLRARQELPEIGRVIHIEGRFCSAGKVEPDEILPHPLSLLQFFLPGGLAGESWAVKRPAAGEFRALSERAALLISMNARPTEASLRIAGTDGTIHLDLFHGYIVRESGRVSRARKVMLPFERAVSGFSAAALNLAGRALGGETAYPGLRRLVREFYRAVREKLPAPISGEDTLMVARVRDRLRQ